LLALFALSLCDFRVGLFVCLWNYILGLRLVIGHCHLLFAGAVNVATLIRFRKGFCTGASLVPMPSRQAARRPTRGCSAAGRLAAGRRGDHSEARLYVPPPLDALDVLGKLKQAGIALYMIDLGRDTTGNGVSKLVFTILSAVAEAERTAPASGSPR
jgi:hypothetical protein